MNISKELLSKVENVGVEVYDIEHFGNNILYKWVMHYVDACNKTQSVVQKDKVNIYELQHKCKEWARDCGYVLSSSMYPKTFGESKTNYAVCLVNEGYISESEIGCDFEAKATTEPEAVFKACQWIYDNKDNQ